MAFKDCIGDRMKAYENCYRFYLPKRQLVAVRLDMRAGHTFTRGFEKPYDIVFATAMQETAKQLCENVSGCRFGYTQSDEISFLLADYENINSEPWFGNNLQKIVSITASMATLFFSRNFKEACDSLCSDVKLEEIYNTALEDKMPCFDSRAFIIPREEASNLIYWRQLDCVRNSIQLLGQAYFSHNQLQNKNSDQIQEMLWQEKGINWSKEPTWFKNGTAIYKEPVKVVFFPSSKDSTPSTVTRNKWCIDTEMPMVSTNPNYVMRHVTFGDNK